MTHATQPTTHRPAAARLLPDRFYYGWLIAFGCGALMFVGVGVGFYGLAVFLRPLQEAHGWSNTAVSGATGMYFAITGVSGALLGPRIDREGPLRIMLIGCLLLGSSVALVGFVGPLWQLYAVYAVLGVAFTMTSSLGVNAIMARWFIARRARALSISFTGVSAGGVVLAPLGSSLIDAGGLELAGPVMGLLVVAVALPVILWVLVWDPAHMDLQPDGRVPHTSVREALSDDVQRRVWTRPEAARTTAFWAILVTFLLVLAAQTGFLLHQISFLEDRFGSRQAASLALSTTAFGSIVARLVVGTFADRLDKRLLTFILFAVQGTAVLAVVAIDNRVATFACVLIVGFTIGNIYMMQTLLVGEIFGIVSFGTVFGLVSMASTTGSGLGPFLVGLLEDTTGGYATPFVITALATYAAGLTLLLARPARPGS